MRPPRTVKSGLYEHKVGLDLSDIEDYIGIFYVISILVPEQ